MAEGHGGYRKPANPAAVSGPGKYSKRTDGAQPNMELPNAGYGENKAFQEIQSGAKLPSQITGSSGAGSAPAAQSFVGMGAPSQQPGTPVTDGADMGFGAGPEALGERIPPNRQDAEFLKKYLPTFIAMAERDDTPPSMKTWVRNIIANL